MKKIAAWLCFWEQCSLRGEVGKHRRAFTLIELLVVIVIIAILATISVAQFNSYQEKARMAKSIAFASQIDHVLMAETVTTGYGFPLRLDFDEGSGTVAKDSSGSGNDISWISSPNINFVTDTPDGSAFALDIDAEQNLIRFIKNMPETEISFSFWVKMHAFPNDTWYTFPIGIPNNSGFRITGTQGVTFYLDNYQDFLSSEPALLKIDRWHHILGTYKEGVMRLFVDGDLEAESTITLDNNFNIDMASGLQRTDFMMGYDAANREFRGIIEGVRIYPVGLDPSKL